MITAGGGDDASGRNGPRKQTRQRATRLERAGVLKQLELENDGAAGESEVRRVDFHHGRATHVRPNQLIGRGDGLSIDSAGFH
jgi:hypothetical protein